LAAKEHKERKKGERYKYFSMCALRFFGAEILFKMQNEPQTRLRRGYGAPSPPAPRLPPS
jgi:hypothetical protein